MKALTAKNCIKRFWTIVLTILYIITMIWSYPTCENELRMPKEPYKTLEEEYIAAIETFIKTEKVVVPEDSYFYFDGNTIKIENNEKTATVTCSFVLDNSVTIYKYNFDSFNTEGYLGIAALLFIFAYFLHMFFYNLTAKLYLIFKKSSDKRKQKKLDNYKAHSEFGDERFSKYPNVKATCINCEKFEDCNCLDCIYIKKCGNCPSNDCIEAFEEFLSDKLSEEDAFDNSIEQTSKIIDKPSNTDTIEKHEVPKNVINTTTANEVVNDEP